MTTLEPTSSLLTPSLWLCLKVVALTMLALSLRPLLESLRSSQRHRLWVVVMAGLLALPLFSTLLPSWGLIPATHPAVAWSLSPQEVAADDGAAAGWSSTAQRRQQLSQAGPVVWWRPDQELVAELAVANNANDATSPTQTTPPTLTLAALTGQPSPGGTVPIISVAWAIWIIWLFGLVGLLLRLGVGHALVWRSIRRASPVERSPELASRVARVTRHSGWPIPHRLSVLISADLGPATYGFLHPKILLPDTAASWTDERLEVVLLHELHHVRKRDWLVGQVANLSAALYWLLPPVWIARRQLELEQERASDDAVIETGIRPSTYASHLLSLATTHRPMGLALAAPAMASRNTHRQLEIRMLSILEPRPRTRLVAPFVLVAFVLAIPVLAAISTSSPSAQPPGQQSPNPSSDLATIIEDIESIGRELEEHEASISAIELESAAIETRLSSAHELAEPYFEELQNIERELTPQIERVMAEMQNEIEPYERQLGELERSLEPHRVEITALQHELEEAHRSAEEAISREHELAMAETQAHIEEATAALEPLIEELHALSAERREALEKRLEQVGTEREEIERRHEEISRRVEERRQVIERELERRSVEMRELHEQMRPALERREEMMRATEPLRQRLRELETRMRPTHEQMERVARSMEAVHQRHSEAMQGAHEELGRRMSEIHERLEPTLERMHEIEVDMAPFHREMEVFHERMRPLHRRLEEAHHRLDESIREHVGRVVDETVAATLRDVTLSEPARTLLIERLRPHLSLEHEDEVVVLYGSQRALEKAAQRVLDEELESSDARSLARALASALSRYEPGRHV